MAREGYGFKDFAFETRTETLGVVRFRRVTPVLATRIEKADFQHDLPPDAFLSLLMVILGTREDGNPVLVEEAYAFSEPEREAFAEAFLAEHGEYYRERILEERKNDLGETVMQSRLGDRIVNPRHAGEGSIDYLTRVYRDFSLGIVTPDPRPALPVAPAPMPPAAPVFAPPPPPPAPVAAAPTVAPTVAPIDQPEDIFGDSHKDFLVQNAALAESLGKSLEQIKMLDSATPRRDDADYLTEDPLIEPAPLPARYDDHPHEATLQVHGALQRADGNEELTRRTFELMERISTSTTDMLDSFAASAEKSARAARTSRRIAIFALGLALLMPIVPVAYDFVKDGQARELFKHLLDRSAAAASEQKQQTDTLKTLADQIRSLRPTPPARIAD